MINVHVPTHTEAPSPVQLRPAASLIMPGSIIPRQELGRAAIVASRMYMNNLYPNRC